MAGRPRIYMTYAEVAALIRVEPDTFRRHRADYEKTLGIPPPACRRGATDLWDPDDLAAWQDGRRTTRRGEAHHGPGDWPVMVVKMPAQAEAEIEAREDAIAGALRAPDPGRGGSAAGGIGPRRGRAA